MMPPKHAGAVVTEALRASGGNISAAARALGQQPQRIWCRLRRHPDLWPAGVPRLLPGGMPKAMRRVNA